MAIGFISRYAHPTVMPTGTGNQHGVKFRPQGDYVAIAASLSPYIHVYAWNNTTGFGAKVADPATLPGGSIAGVAWSPDGAYLAVCRGVSPYIWVYPFSGGVLGDKIADPSTLSSGGLCVAWHPSGAYVAVGQGASPRIVVWNFSGGAFGAKVSDPASAFPNGSPTTLGWNPAGTYLAAISGSTGAKIHAYAWSSGFGSKVSDPGSAVPGTALTMIWSPDGAYLIVGSSTSPRLTAYPFTTGFGTPLADPTTIPTSAINMSFSPDGAYLAVAAGLTSPRVRVYPWNPGFGAVLTDPTEIPLSQVNSVDFGTVSPYPLGTLSSSVANLFFYGPLANTVAPAVTGTPTVGETLATTDGTWNVTPDSVAYQWQRDGMDIGGATANTHALVAGDVGAMVRCVVTATKAEGTASANSNAVGPIASASASGLGGVAMRCRHRGFMRRW